jgi:hypothetical protein
MTPCGTLFGRRLVHFSNAAWPDFRAPLTLFAGPARAMRADPRFLPLMERLGLMA